MGIKIKGERNKDLIEMEMGVEGEIERNGAGEEIIDKERLQKRNL